MGLSSSILKETVYVCDILQDFRGTQTDISQALAELK